MTEYRGKGIGAYRSLKISFKNVFEESDLTWLDRAGVTTRWSNGRPSEDGALRILWEKIWGNVVTKVNVGQCANLVVVPSTPVLPSYKGISDALSRFLDHAAICIQNLQLTQVKYVRNEEMRASTK